MTVGLSARQPKERRQLVHHTESTQHGPRSPIAIGVTAILARSNALAMHIFLGACGTLGWGAILPLLGFELWLVPQGVPAAKARRCARPAACFRGAIGMPCGGLPAHIGGRPCPRFPAPHSDHGCRESSECTPVPVAGEHLPSLPISRAGELPLTTYNIDAIIITRNSQSSPLALTHTGARPPTPTFRSS